MTAAGAGMGSAEPRVVEHLRHLVESRQWDALRDYLVGILPDERTEAAHWFAKKRRYLLADAHDWRQYGAGRSIDQTWDLLMVIHILTVVLDSPVSAARILPWRDFPIRTVHILLLLDVLASRGESWCRGFVAAAIARNARSGERTAINVVRCCLPLMLHFGIEPKDFEAYPRVWAWFYRSLVGARSHEVWNDESAAHFEYTGWSGVEFRIGNDGRAQLFPKMQKSLLELWDQDATAPETLLRCFELPNLLGALTYRFNAENWGVETAVRGYIERGTFSRESVIAHVHTALARGDSMPTQRVLLDVLKVLSLDPREMAASVPLWLSTVAAAPGFLSGFALQLLLKTPLDGRDLEDLSATVFGRPEKNLQKQLVRHLKSQAVTGNYDGAVVAACWQAAAGSSDLEIQAIATKTLGTPRTPTDPEAPAPAQLWATGVRQPAEKPFAPLRRDPRRALAEQIDYYGSRIQEEQNLELLLRALYRRPPELREEYRKKYPFLVSPPDNPRANGLLETSWGHWATPSPGFVLRMWASGEHNVAAHRSVMELLRCSMSEPLDYRDPFGATNPLGAVRILRFSELAVVTGTAAYSLATPSYANFRVSFERLIPALQWYEREGLAYGEADMFQALLRLGPTSGIDAEGLERLDVKPLDGSDDPERNAGRILRDWVAGGGFVAPQVDEPLTLPLQKERFPSIPQHLFEAELWNTAKRSSDGNAAEVPFWPELGAVWRLRPWVDSSWSEFEVSRLGMDAWVADDLGVHSHEWIVRALASAHEKTRDAIVQIVLVLAEAGQLSADHLAAAAPKCLKAGGLSLGRLVRNLALVAYEGYLDLVWPTLVALVVAIGEEQRLPAGSPEILASCTEFWDCIPVGHRTAENVPREFVAAVRALASLKSATKTFLEANRLLSAMGIQPAR